MRPLLTVVLLLAAGITAAAQSLDDAMKRAAADYSARLQQAEAELQRTRERIARDKAPLLAEMRAAEGRIIALEREILRLETGRAEAGANRQRLARELAELNQTAGYLTTQAQDGLRALGDGLAPGEDPLVAAPREEVLGRLGAPDAAGGPAVGAAVELLIARTERVLGGDVRDGAALRADDNRLVEGRFAFVGPETFFQAAVGGGAGVVRLREGSRQPVFHPLAEWPVANGPGLFEGGAGAVLADASGGKALRLQQAGGTLREHIDKGGKVAYLIVLVGLVAAVLIVLKIRDVTRLRVDPPERVESVLRAVAAGSRGEAEAALAGLGRSTRELLAAGLRHLDEPREILEERLEAVLLGQRLEAERRLPLLAVIATAAPLLGLLGTVVGMVKTFTLITVFGTGDAAKLSSGISEVLVATELGLAVAIPALVVHGFLAHRIHKSLALLERHAVEFITAAAVARRAAGRATEEVRA